MMSEQDLADVVQIAVEDLSPDHPVVLENHVVTDEDEPALKRQRLEINCQDPSIKSFLYSINQTICLRLDSIEAKLQALEATCKSLEEKLDLVTNKQHSPIQVPMVAGSPLGQRSFGPLWEKRSGPCPGSGCYFVCHRYWVSDSVVPSC
uniref:BTG3 associated nuclear protein n=1 Tax=Spermophilus dauricus TaxID=99837 RepID=A0A8C9P9B8_SPEDA